MHMVAAARTFWLCGTEKCPSEFATDRVSTVSGNKSKSGLVWVFFDRITVDMSKERARRVRLGGYHLVDPVVELEEQNAIELVPAPLVSSHTCKGTFRRLCAEG